MALADDTTAGFWNPAGLAFVNNRLTQLEVKFDSVNVEYAPLGGIVEENAPRAIFAPAVGLIMPLQDDRLPALGILGYAPYGLRLDWNANAAYRYNVIADEMRVVSAGVGTAYRANDRFALGIAAFANDGQLTLVNAVSSLTYAGVPGLPDATFMATGDDTSPNLHVGALWHANTALRVGLAYRSPITLDIRGDADLVIPGGPVITDQWSMPLDLPQSASLGFAWQATPLLLVATQADWVDWSSIDQQVITFRQGAIPDQQIARDWHDRVQLRIGVEYSKFTPIMLRAGYSYDPTPVPATTLDPLLMDLNRHIFSAGIGTSRANWACDMSYEHFFGQSRTTNASVHAFPTDGRYAGDVDVITLTISYRH